MGEAVIRVDGLGKCYRLGDRQKSYKTLRDTLAAAARKPFRVVRRLLRREDSGPRRRDQLWALKDVSFEVQRGEVLGVIGRNGAGKSTLLKILSRITEPTEGGADIHGRVGPLLEVGTGFHPELTGRENIYLNGAILGMKRAEIESKFDEIVAFAEVERFIDTPVKHYSSGMYLRLAFAVAAHLEPEILLVDEVLAVGDASFQKKCLGKMGDVASRGRTVFFVSHNLAAINQLCDRCLVLEGGRLTMDGPSAECVDYYLRAGECDAATIDADTLPARAGTGAGRITRVEIVDEAGQRTHSVGIGEPFTVRLQATFRERVARASLGIEVVSPTGVPILNLRTDAQGLEFGPYDGGGMVSFEIRIPGLPFYPGTYALQPWLAEHGGRRLDHIRDGIVVKLESKGRYRSEMMLQGGRGLVVMDCDWTDRVDGAR